MQRLLMREVRSLPSSFEKYYPGVAGGIFAIMSVYYKVSMGIYILPIAVAIIDVKLWSQSHLIKAADGGSFAFNFRRDYWVRCMTESAVFARCLCWQSDYQCRWEQKRVRKNCIVRDSPAFCGLPVAISILSIKLWTSSYTLVTCAGRPHYSYLTDRYYIDVRQRKGWSRFFRAFGVNLFMYCVGWIASVLIQSIVHTLGTTVSTYAVLLYNQTPQPLLGDYLGSFIYALIFIIIICFWGCGYILYRKRIYIKL